jgi:glutamate-ammonia-ligase adenylyltransferase|tara:strand:+ start:163324 stop:166023 length:2700 start_codon:yes stop_codon:yes gene_type:complete
MVTAESFADCCSEAALADAIALAERHAPFLRALMKRHPHWGREIADAGLAAFIAAPVEAETVAVELRQRRQRVALGTALADLSGAFDLVQVTRALSDFADVAIDSAVRQAFVERVGEPSPRGFTAIALGKLGSRELNYSSDVDLIFIYDGDRIARREGDDPDTAAVRIAWRTSELLQQPTKDGYVARVDLRLRPDAEVNPVAIPLRRAELYYQSGALTWERAAFIRARAVAGDMEMGETFLRVIDPFVWRRSLDYTAIRDIEDMSLRIRDHYEDRQTLGPGFDLKRGRGGIREIEFFAQVQQLIFGGRDENLRIPDTPGALAALADAGQIDRALAADLSASYELLRNAEHRLQMREDAQTHSIPTRKEDRNAFAALCGEASYARLEAKLKPRLDRVSAAYDELTARAERPPVPRGKALAEYVAKAGVGSRQSMVRLIDKWRDRAYPALRSDAAQRELEQALPLLIDAFAALPSVSNALNRFDDFLGRVPSALRFFALIAANPRLAGLLSRVMGHAPLLAGKLARRPDLFDAMIGGASADLATRDALCERAAAVVGAAPDFERSLDAARHWAGEQRFTIGVSLLEGRATPAEAARAYADTADAAIAALTNAVVDDFAEAHGRVADGDPIVLAFGRYGGRALTERSDLDLVFLFSGAHETRSDGPQALGATGWFNRMFQRLVSALTVPTAAGPLYEIDTRLRPSGAQGLLAVSLDTFAAYQVETAWTWEHMALTRARLVVGHQHEDAVRIAIRAALDLEREPDVLRRDVSQMRADMMAAHPETGPLDVKRGRGGLIDLEFIIHYRQLLTGVALSPELGVALDALIADGQVDAALLDAHRTLSAFLVMSRLVGDAIEGPGAAATRALVAARCDARDWTSLKADIASARRAVAAEWKRQFGKD